MKIEYLILVKKEGSFCETVNAFVDILKIDSKISIEGSTLKYSSSKGSESFYIEYKVKSDEVKGKDERYFLLQLFRKDKTRIDEYSELIRLIKKIVEKINPNNVKISTLWDDIALDYAKNAYPLISNVENQMRKLISKFMLINVGMDWSKRALDNDLKKVLINKKEEIDMHFDDVYKLDFIHLSEFLFTKYRTVDYNKIDKLISAANVIDDLVIDELKSFLPVSNWERYFNNVIDYNEEKLKNNWKELYTLRNKIAHNRGLSKSEFDKVKKLVGDFNSVIEKALESLDEIELNSEEKDTVAKHTDDFVNTSSNIFDIIKFDYNDEYKKIILSNFLKNNRSKLIIKNTEDVKNIYNQIDILTKNGKRRLNLFDDDKTNNDETEDSY